MYLKSLEMQGFKSFPDKTKLVFEKDTEVNLLTDKDGKTAHGVTVIVGPNGSGKSNIADAMRWVLGEISSKSLRGSKMEDVIFGGADSRRPMGYAEVSVTFDNRGEFSKLECPFDEVTVTRRYYRAGESEYFINRKGVRLKDIYELFMNTGIGRDGYSIIGQGRIAEMVSRKSEERRSVFEDASGIAKYRYRKNEAERKLAEEQGNMDRVNDIFSVLSSQIGPLEKESEKAKKALELIESKKKADVSLWLFDTEKLHDELSAAEELLNHASFDLQMAEDSIQSLETQNAKLFEASEGSKRESEELLSEISEQTEICHNLDSAFRVSETNINHAKDLIAATEGNVASTQTSIANETATCKEHDAKIGELEQIAADIAKEQSVLSEEQKKLTEEAEKLDREVAESLNDIRELETQATDLLVRISAIEGSKITDTDKNSNAVGELEEYRKTSAKLTAEVESKSKTVEKYDAELASIDEKITDAKMMAEKAENAYREAAEQVSTAIFRKDSVAQRINTFRSMEEHFEGYSNAVRFVMQKYEEKAITDRDGAPCGTVYGPLSKVVSVEDRYITAIETSLGTNLQNIVVEDESAAKAAMAALKRGEAGRATFFPLTSMKPSEPTKELSDAAGFEGYIGLADTLVKADAKFKNVLSSLLGRTAVFDNIDHATVMAKSLHYRVRTVTLDGQQINVGGSFTGGSVRTGNGILSRAGEMKRLEAELSEKEDVLKKLQKEAARLKEALDDAENIRTSLNDQKELIGVLRSTENAQLDQLKAKFEANETLLKRLAEDMKEYEAARSKYDEEIANLTAEEKEIRRRIDEIKSFRTDKSSAHGDAMLRLDEIARKTTELYIKASETQKDIETAKTLRQSSTERIDALQKELLTFEGRINTQIEQIRLTKEAMDTNRFAYDAANQRLEQLNAKRREVEAGNMEFEKKLNDLNGKLRDRMNHKENVFREYTKCESKLANLRDAQDKLAGKLWEDYELTRADALALGYPPLTKETRPQMLSLQTDCRNRLKAMGNVDLDAVNKYAEMKTQYDDLNKQIEDLEKSRKYLEGFIQDMEDKMKGAFIESFNKINENFGHVFSELFGGGSAELSLTDPDNVLESGIEIKAAPPGKIIKSLMQLSGGEQAFIGVALFFAILQVTPTPFCILDEIEAALDEVNVERLAQYIKRYSHGTQFIMITHRRGTMAAADRLYGVTMPEHGISKVLMLNVDDISKEKGDEWNGIFG